MSSATLLRLVLLLPLAGAVLNGVAPLFLKEFRTREGFLGTIGTAVVAIPFVIAVYLFVTFGGEPIVADYFTWMAAGDLDLAFAYRIDELSLIMTLVEPVRKGQIQVARRHPRKVVRHDRLPAEGDEEVDCGHERNRHDRGPDRAQKAFPRAKLLQKEGSHAI